MFYKFFYTIFLFAALMLAGCNKDKKLDIKDGNSDDNTLSPSAISEKLNDGIINSDKVLIISDVDDTLKITGVGNAGVAAHNNYNTKRMFLGMLPIYEYLSGLSNIRISYISAAPEYFSGESQREFLKQFPKGNHYLKPSVFDNSYEYKVYTIKREIEKFKPISIILIGDNHSTDINAYNRIADIYNKKIKVVTFIHIVYSGSNRKLFKNQIPYVTAAELAAHLGDLNFIDKEWAEEFIQKETINIIDADNKVLSQYFPLFKNCSDYHWTLGNNYAELRNKLEEVCAKSKLINARRIHNGPP